ncbi:unnamed protein product [Symbiodinium sp. CCMP2592]|nr:unnamed protein product [Symbiodinium sp. CCMP2592]
MQQVELAMHRAFIEDLQKKVDPDQAEASMIQQTSDDRVQEAHGILKRVVQKHAHQRQHREYHPEVPKKHPEEGPASTSPPGHQRSLLQRRNRDTAGRGIIKSIGSGLKQGYDYAKKTGGKVYKGLSEQASRQVDNAVKSLDGDGLTGGALAETYRQVKAAGNTAQFMANTAISTVEMAVTILTQGFSDWDADCTNAIPSIGVEGSNLYVNFGHNSCTVSLMSQRITLFDWNWGKKTVPVGNLLNLMPQQLKNLADANLAPSTLLNLMPQQLRNLANANLAPSASCTNVAPTIGVEGNDIYVNFGHNSCSVTLMGRTTSLFNWNWGRKSVNLPVLSMLPEQVRTLANAPVAVINSQITFATGISNCINADQPLGLIECLGYKIIERVPPLSYLNKMSDILTEVIEVFARIAATVVEKAMEKGPSLVQVAATGKFPAAGEPALLHHKTNNLIIESHTRQLLPREMAAIQKDVRHSEAGDDPDGAITFDMGSSNDVHATKLITQFEGRETDTSSCLAFAPKNRAGSGVSQADWKVGNQNDFLQLEPWAVPCDNTWMKDNWNRWQGYTFYTQPSAVEKCVTVTFNLGMQPVVAFVGGLQFEILPAPLFELATTVCWPSQQPGGVDLSVLRSEVKSAGILLFSRTLRLTKRFGGGTDFIPSNARGGYSTWRSSAGIAEGETTVPKDQISRTSFLETNQNQSQEEEEVEGEEGGESLWKTDSEDLYLASVDYGENLNTSVNKTFEAYGQEAAMKAGEDVFRLFRFRNPGLVNFKVEGLMNGNSLELGMEMGFGPYKSPPRRIPLVNIAHQFSIILAGIPFVSSRSKLKAIDALRDFSMQDVSKAQGLPLKPGSLVAIYSPHWQRFLHINGGAHLGVTAEMKGHGIPDHWTWERFTVVDAGNGEIALHCAIHNRFVGVGGVSPKRNVHELPHDWGSERFTVVEAGNGAVGFYNRAHNRFLQMTAHGAGHSDHPPNPGKLPSDWTWQHFRVVPAEKLLVPGSTIALHSQIQNHYVTMHGGSLERSPERTAEEVPPDWWTWQRFTVVDAGHRQIALHNSIHNRFVGVGAVSPHRLVDQLPSDWASERWDVWPAGNGQIVLHNRHHNKMLRMSGHTVDASHPKDPKQLPDNWTRERFRVVHLKPYLQPGATVALRCPHHGRYIMMYAGAPSTLLLARDNQTQNDTWVGGGGFGNIHNHIKNSPAVQQVNEAARKAQEAAEAEAARQRALLGSIGRSPERGEEGIPDDWTWERFTVIDAGNGQVAFHSSIRNRYLKMDGDRMLVSSPKAPDRFPSDWTYERFTVLYDGLGKFMFHNSKHNRMIRMTGEKVDASSEMNPQDVPGGWTSERFQIVPARPYLQPGTVVALHCAVHNRYVSMSGAALQRSGERGVDDLPGDWTSERFTVVDAGNGQVAFHNAAHNRFLEMRPHAKMGCSNPHAVSDLQDWWTWQRFTVVPAGNGQFVFHNTLHNRMIRMTDHIMDASGEKSPQDLPSGWTSERFRIVRVSEASETAQNVRATFD